MAGDDIGCEFSLGWATCSTRSALISAQAEVKKGGGKKSGGEGSKQKEKERTGLESVEKSGGGDVGDKKEGEGKGKEEAKPTDGGFARDSGDLKNAVVTEEDRLGLDDPKGERDEGEKESVVDEKACENEEEVSETRK